MNDDCVWNHADPYAYIQRVQAYALPPLIITVAITGGFSGKETNPNIPETPAEQAIATHEAYRAGASIVHIHARDETGAGQSTDPEVFRDIHRRVRALCPDIIVNNTMGVEAGLAREEVLRILEALPEMASLNMGATNMRYVKRKRSFPLTGRDEDETVDAVSAVTTGEIEGIARTCLERDIKPELCILTSNTLWALQNLIEQDLLRKPYWIQLFFCPNLILPTPKELINTIDCLPQGSLFSAMAAGPHELPMATLSILLGGHVRIGLEDNIHYRKDELATSSAQLVERIVRIARELGRSIATPAQARKMLGLCAEPRRW